MTRPLRIDYPGAVHHVVNRGARRQRVFLDDEDRLNFLDLVDKAHERYGLIAHAFCLMDNHFHFVVETPTGQLSRSLHLVESVFVHRFNRRHELDGPLFGGRFYSRLIQVETYLARAIKYVERNPLEAGMVDDLLDYPWSSYRMFFEPGLIRPRWLSEDGLRVAGIESREDLRAFVYSDSNKNQNRFNPSDFGSVIGDDDFIAAALARSARSPDTIGHLRATTPRPTPDVVEQSVADVFKVDASRIRRRSQGTRSDARLAAIGLNQDLAALPLAEIADRFELASARSAADATSRFRVREQADGLFGFRVEQVRRQLLDGNNGVWPSSLVPGT